MAGQLDRFFHETHVTFDPESALRAFEGDNMVGLSAGRFTNKIP